MSGFKCGRGSGLRGMSFPDSEPPGLNHSVLTGELSADPQEGRSPSGDPVTFLRIEFPIADPVHPRTLWAWAGIGIEVADPLARERVKGLQGGAPILVAGQISERWIVEKGRSHRRSFIVASSVHSGPLPDQRGEL